MVEGCQSEAWARHGRGRRLVGLAGGKLGVLDTAVLADFLGGFSALSRAEGLNKPKKFQDRGLCVI